MNKGKTKEEGEKSENESPNDQAEQKTLSPLEELQKQIQEKDNKIAEITNIAKRVQADFENYKKRVENEFDMIQANANKKLIIELLDIVDHLENALAHEQTKEELVTGIKMIHQELVKILDNKGVKKIETKEFNPKLHMPLMAENDKTKKNQEITGVFQHGYTLNNIVIRPAKVKINKLV